MGKFDGILILSDMDGTLTMNEHLSCENADAIRYFQGNGGYFSVATGRQPWYIKSFEPEMVVNAPVVALNGTVIFDITENKLLVKTPLPADAADILSYVMVHYPHIEFFGNTLTDSINWYQLGRAPHSLDFLQEEIMKILFCSSNPNVISALKEELSEKFPRFSFLRSWENGLELLPPHCGKGECLSYFKKLLPLHTIIGVGDYENDITLITQADIGYAAGNAVPFLLKKADRIAPHASEHIIATIISDIENGLIEKQFSI